MIKSFLNGVIGGFSRTLGRILFYILIALIFYFIFGMKKVEAAELNINANVYSTIGNTFYQRMYSGYSYYNGHYTESNFSLGTTYSGKLQRLSFRVDRTFNYTNSYTLTLQANTADFRNNFNSVVISDLQNTYDCNVINLQFVSKYKVTTTFICPYQTNSLQFIFYANEGGFFTGDTNFNIKNVLLEENTNTQNNDDIINNNNQNTQDIIDNNNSNTQDIINNINENFNNCLKTDVILNASNIVTQNRYLTSDGSFGESAGYGVSDYVEILPDADYLFTASSSTPNAPYFCIYAQDKSVINCIKFERASAWNFHTSNYAKYFRTTIADNTNIQNYTLHLVSSEVCVNKLDSITDSINGLNGTLTDLTPADTSIFSDWWTNFTENYYSNPLGNLITLPINLVQKLINYSNTACSPVQLGSLLGTNLTLSCFTLGDIITNIAVLNVIDLIMSLSLIVFTLKKAYETVSNLLSLGGENEVKQHFKFPTPMEFIASLFGGGK